MLTLSGPPKSGKTRLALQMALFVSQHDRVLYVAMEDTLETFRRPLLAAQEGTPGSDPADRFSAISGIGLDEAGLRGEVADLLPGLVVIDGSAEWLSRRFLGGLGREFTTAVLQVKTSGKGAGCQQRDSDVWESADDE